MTNIATVFKTEISRLARKEVRAEIASLKKASSQHRSTIAALRRELEALKRRLRTTARSRPQEEQPDEEQGVRLRFRRGGLVTHRKTLGLSAADYGKLAGVSAQTIYHWEDGKSRPRAAQLQSLAAIRGLGKREAAQRLEQLNAAQTQSRPQRRRAKAAA